MTIILTCGCRSDDIDNGILCEWDTETRQCEPAIACGVLCSKHYVSYEARPIEKDKHGMEVSTTTSTELE
jgi:hypothetical protein